MIKCICPFCGSSNIQVTGGENGDPFDRRPEKTVCLDCGRTISEEKVKPKIPMPDPTAPKIHIELKKPVVVIEMTASAANVTRNAKIELPFEDGEYPLKDYDYPFPRFGRIIIRGDTIDLDGEISKLTGQILETEKHFTACGFDRYTWDETVKIKIYTDRKRG